MRMKKLLDAMTMVIRDDVGIESGRLVRDIGERASEPCRFDTERWIWKWRSETKSNNEEEC